MTKDDVQNLLNEFHTPAHVRRHAEAVTNFALELGKKLIAAGEKIDLELLERAGLIHDFVRVVDFRELNPEKFPDLVTDEDIKVWSDLREKYRGLHHAEAGARILEERGFIAEAKLVRAHAFLHIEKGFDLWEEKLLYYADKRVMHDKVVSLKERLADGKKRNSPETQSGANLLELDQKVFALENEILTHIQ